MSSSDHYWKVPLVLGALFQLALGGPGGGVAVARSLQAETSGTQITVQTGAGQIVRLKQDVSSLFSADPKVAEVRPASPSSFFVFGVGAGNTTIEAASATGEVIGRYVVRVVPSSYRASVLQQGAAMSSPGVRVEPTPDGLSIEGSASDPQAAQKLVDHARSLAGKEGYIADYMTVPGSLQVNLRVRVVEMERTLVRELGVEWKNVNALGTSAVVGVATQSPLAALSNLQSSVGWLSRFNVGNQRVTLETVVDALAQDGLVHSLAEPNLTTLSGQPASFLVGGEYPIPVSNYGGTTTVQFKQYGISLGFVPTVLAEGRINLHVRPEVSALSSDGAVTLSTSSNSVQIPAIHVRRADTTVELGSGQSFVIAGLLSDTSKLTTTGLPWLGDIPVLGALFKSNSFQKDETELVIIVTPYLVKPVDNIHDLHTPDEDWVPPGDMERIFLMRQSSTDVRKRRAWQKLDAGDAGFMVE